MASKRLFALIALLIVTVLSFSLVLTACDDNGDSSQTETLVVYNWEDYIDESEETSRIDAFVEYYKAVTGKDINVVYSTFDTNETMMTKVLNNDANSVDLICPSEYAIQKLMANGRLANISDLVDEYKDEYVFNNLADGTMSNTDSTFVNAINREFSSVSTGDGTGNMTDYMVPYMMGTIGILYNIKYVTEEDLASGWGMLWNASGSELLENKILVKDSVRDTYAAAVMYMREYGLLPEGYEDMPIADLINCTDDAMLDAASQVLTAQREHISGYEVDFGKDDMLNEIVYADLAWSGDALWAIEESYDEDELYYNPRTGEYDNYMLDYYVPMDEDGKATGNIWFDGWVIPKSAPNKLAALLFIDFMNMPENAIYNSIYIGYTSAVAREKMMYTYVGTGGSFDLVDGEYVYSDGGAYAINEDVYNALVDSEYALSPEDNEGEYDFSFFEDDRRYPTETSQLGVMRDFGDRQKNAVTMWENAKTGDDVPWVLIYCSVAILGGFGLFGIFYSVKNLLKRRPRKVKE
jgi:spermidine/putrescine transport system substrate-binding protein